MSIRTRLTLWYTAVLAALVIAFGVAVYAILSVSLSRQIDQSLVDTATKVLQASRVRTVQDVRIVTIPELEVFRASSVYVQVWQAGGTLVNQSSNLGNFRDPLDASALDGQTQITRDMSVGGVHLRVLTVPITVEGRLGGYLQVAASLSRVDEAKGLLLVILGGGGAVAVGLAAMIGAFLSARALHPIDTVTDAALQITRADDLSRRIPLEDLPNDEVTRLIGAFNETLERLERMFTAQRRFLADVSHELRTPLTAIRGNVDLLRRMGGADQASLDAIQSEAERMSRLVGDLLLLAQAETGHLPIAREPVELDTLMLEVFQQARVLAGNTTEVAIGEEDQARVNGDRDRLKQLLLNLVSNALHFTPEGGRVTLGLTCVHNWARLTVTDSGPGIPADELPQIFERFYRVSKSRERTTSASDGGKESHGGAGLGLSIAQWIAKVHGGRIEVASDVGRGSTFSVWLPLAP